MYGHSMSPAKTEKLPHQPDLRRWFTYEAGRGEPGFDEDTMYEKLGPNSRHRQDARSKTTNEVEIHDLVYVVDACSAADGHQLIHDALQYPEWSLPFAALLLNGYVAPYEHAGRVLSRARDAAKVSAAEYKRVERTYRVLLDEFGPESTPYPGRVLRAAAGWPEGLRPVLPDLLWDLVRHGARELRHRRDYMKKLKADRPQNDADAELWRQSQKWQGGPQAALLLVAAASTEFQEGNAARTAGILRALMTKGAEVIGRNENSVPKYRTVLTWLLRGAEGLGVDLTDRKKGPKHHK